MQGLKYIESNMNVHIYAYTPIYTYAYITILHCIISYIIIHIKKGEIRTVAAQVEMWWESLAQLMLTVFGEQA